MQTIVNLIPQWCKLVLKHKSNKEYNTSIMHFGWLRITDPLPSLVHVCIILLYYVNKMTLTVT